MVKNIQKLFFVHYKMIKNLLTEKFYQDVVSLIYDFSSDYLLLPN